MAKYGSSSVTVFLVGGYDFIANKLQGLGWKEEPVTTMTHGLGDTSEIVTPVGVKKYTLTQNGAFFDDTANTMHDRLKTGGATSRVVCFTVAGNSVAAPFVGCLGALHVTYEVLAQNENLTLANAGYQVSGESYWGQIVQPWATKTADWNTKTLGTVVDYTLDPSQVVIPIASASKAATCVVTTSVAHGLTTGQVIFIASNTLAAPAINGQQTVTVTSTTTFTVAVDTSLSTGAGTGGSFVRASTVNGGVGFQQVSAFSGFTGYVGKIQDSADDSTYADLATFTNVTSGPTAESVTVTGTVDRYLSLDGNIVGSGSITVFAGFART